ncbi:MAG: Hsp20/alpha crystallin family protein [bacterium]
MEKKIEKQNQSAKKVYSPTTDIYTNEDGFILYLDVPGCDQDDVNINVENNILNIKAEPKNEAESKTDLIYQEFELGTYERTFTLPRKTDVNKIEASMKDGTLKVVLPFSEEVKPKKIEIKKS